MISSHSNDPMQVSPPTVRPMAYRDEPAVARLHAEEIRQGFLSRLGEPFLRALYVGIAKDPGSRVLVAAMGATVIGFCAYSRNVTAMYRSVLCRRGVILGLATLPRSLNPSVLVDIVDTLSYPSKQQAAHLPAAEILAIAVSRSMHGRGIGRALLEAACAQAAGDGEPEVKVLAGAALEQANAFYLQNGFVLRTQIIQHGEPLNVYVRHLNGSPTGAPTRPEADA
jgi:GNAT superfamily N-acetyltransferase